MDESQDPKPHPHLHEAQTAHEAAAGVQASRMETLSIWFFVGILTLVYGAVLVVQGLLELHHPPPNEVALPFLIPLHPTLAWGLCLFLFGAFYTARFRPRRR